MRLTGIIGILAIGMGLSAQAGLKPKSIYGDDDRSEVKNYHDKEMVKRAQSVAGAVHYKALTPADRNGDFFQYDKYILQEEIDACTGQAYNDQYMLMGCSGFLIGPKTILTAGHCIMEQEDCDNLRWVFDFHNDTDLIPKENVYKCKKIVKTRLESSMKKIYDYAIIELEEAPGRPALEYRKKGKVLPGSKLTVIGHPMGLPMKIADNGRVAMMTKEDAATSFEEFITALTSWNYTFFTTLDSFEGNSGSPVFNSKTGVVEGILIEGNEDYEITDLYGDGSHFCRKLVKTKDRLWNAAERVQRITKIKEIQ